MRATRFCNLCPIDALRNRPISDDAGRTIGRLRRIMLFVPHGTIAYAVVGYGGVWGLFEKQAALPWTAFRLKRDDGRLVLDGGRAELRVAPRINPRQPPDFSHADDHARIYALYHLHHQPPSTPTVK